MKKLMVLGLGLGLTGCASMWAHYELTDEDVKDQARAMALVTVCAQKKIEDGSEMFAFNAAINQMHTVTVYNEDLYKTTYMEAIQELLNTPVANYTNACHSMAKQAPLVTQNLNQRYQDITQARMAEMVGAFAPPSQTTTVYTSAPASVVNTNQPSFGVPRNKTRTTVVNGNNGASIHTCTETTSGISICQ